MTKKTENTEEMAQKEVPEVPQPIEDPCILPENWNIYQRLNWVRSKVSYVKKDASVQGQGYKAVSHDAVTAMARPFLVQAGILVFPDQNWSKMQKTGTSTKNGVPFWRYRARYVVSFAAATTIREKAINADGVISAPLMVKRITVESHAIDQGDKAPGKALSYAVKYALLKVLSLETGEDDESRQEQQSNIELEAERLAYQKSRLIEAINEHMDTITAVKDGIREGNLSTAAEAWFELSNDEKRSIWAAPSKGGPFTTEERKVIKSTEFREAHYGKVDPKYLSGDTDDQPE